MFRWFIFRRLHSLLGLGLVLFLVEHLYINSRAALPVREGSSPYIEAVNQLQSMPLLIALEVLLIGLPLLVHGVLGVIYLKTGRYGFPAHDGSQPVMSYRGQHFYVIQRWASWVLLIGIAIHVVQMRFLARPVERVHNEKTHYEMNIVPDAALYRMAKEIPLSISPEREEDGFEAVTVRTADFGTAELLLIRQTFQSPGWMIFYTLFVLSAVFHAFQGLWTFLLSWGAIISPQAQRFFHVLSTVLMCAVAAMGLVAIFGAYLAHH